MMDELTVPLKRSFSDLIFGIYGNDLKEVVDSLEEMDVIRKVGECLYGPVGFSHMIDQATFGARVLESRWNPR